MNVRHNSARSRRPLRGALWAAIFLCLHPASAWAASVTVDCTAAVPPPGVFNSITAALFTLDNIGPHTVTVTGPCTEAVNIQQRDRLTIQPAPAHTAVISAPAPGVPVLIVGGSHNINLRGLVLRGGGTGLLITRGSTVAVQGVSLTENTGNGLRIDTGSVVILTGTPPFPPVNISDNEGAGISADASVLSVNGGLTVEGNAGPAMNVIGGRLVVNGQQFENVFRDNGTGINLDGTVANFNGQNTIRDNDLTGVQIISGRAAFSGSTNPSTGETRSTVIEGHTLGVNVVGSASVGFSGPNRVRNNGGGNPDAEFRGGIRIGTVGRVQIDGPNEITGNTGPGVFLDFNGALAIAGAVVTNNTEGGVRVARSSVGNFGLGNILSGNGGAQLSCDDTSLIAGPGLAGLPNKAVACKNIEHEKGPSRPSIPK